MKEIVSLVDLARDEWPLAFIRELADICCGIRNPHPFTGAQGALDEYARLLPAVWLRAFPQK